MTSGINSFYLYIRFGAGAKRNAFAALGRKSTTGVGLVGSRYPVRATYMAFIQRELAKTQTISPHPQPIHRGALLSECCRD